MTDDERTQFKRLCVRKEDSDGFFSIGRFVASPSASSSPTVTAAPSSIGASNSERVGESAANQSQSITAPRGRNLSQNEFLSNTSVSVPPPTMTCYTPLSNSSSGPSNYRRIAPAPSSLPADGNVSQPPPIPPSSTQNGVAAMLLENAAAVTEEINRMESESGQASTSSNVFGFGNRSLSEYLSPIGSPIGSSFNTSLGSRPASSYFQPNDTAFQSTSATARANFQASSGELQTFSESNHDGGKIGDESISDIPKDLDMANTYVNQNQVLHVAIARLNSHFPKINSIFNNHVPADFFKGSSKAVSLMYETETGSFFIVFRYTQPKCLTQWHVAYCKPFSSHTVNTAFKHFIDLEDFTQS